ncbi:MAG: helix-turn-helix domain-containing protein [Candidatus Acidiferrales bacterium]
MSTGSQAEYESKGEVGESQMKPRTAQFGARKNPDSPRVHGLRLTANPSSLKSEELPGNAEQKTGSPPAERFGLSVTETTEARQAVEPLLDCAAAAAVLGGLHPKTVERWAREGRIPAYRYFRHWRFRISDLEIWMRSHVQSACHPCRLNQEKSDGT